MSKNIKKPNFFIIGAPKCGTTSLSEYLRDHPDVFFSTPKEANYFTDYARERGVYNSLNDYLKRCFSESAGYMAVGEGTTRYLRSPESVPRILDFNPEAKFIVMIRNPVEMFQSLYWQRVYEGKEEAKDLQQAWRRQDSNLNEELQYGKICKLGEQLESVYGQVLEKEKILVIFYDDFKIDTKAVYKQTLDFLGVKDDGRQNFPVSRKRKTTRYGFMLSLIKKGGRLKRKMGIKKSLTDIPVIKHIISRNKELPSEFKKELTEYFLGDIEKIEKLTKRDLSHWKRS